MTDAPALPATPAPDLLTLTDHAPADDREPHRVAGVGRVHRVCDEPREIGAHPDADAPGNGLLANRAASSRHWPASATGSTHTHAPPATTMPTSTTAYRPTTGEIVAKPIATLSKMPIPRLSSWS